MTKTGKKSKIVSVESIPPFFFVCFSLSVIVICIVLLSSIHIELFFQDKV